jgi:hypothetical protein
VKRLENCKSTDPNLSLLIRYIKTQPLLFNRGFYVLACTIPSRHLYRLAMRTLGPSVHSGIPQMQVCTVLSTYISTPWLCVSYILPISNALIMTSRSDRQRQILPFRHLIKSRIHKSHVHRICGKCIAWYGKAWHKTWFFPSYTGIQKYD